MKRRAKWCWALDARPWVLMTADVVAALLFVAGCAAFYVPAWYRHGVSLFLAGSLLMLAATLARAFVRYGPSS